MSEQEGVIKYHLDYEESEVLEDPVIADLCAWHRICFQLGLVGQDPAFYDGAAYGNLSARIESESGELQFAITGTGTGGRAHISRRDFSRVLEFDCARNSVRANGPVPPSSESLTHGMLYQLHPDIGSVVHVHSPDMWNYAREVELPCTPADVPYGTPEMAEAVTELFHLRGGSPCGVFCMLGHQDGVVGFGEDPRHAAGLVLAILARAGAHQF